MEKIIKTWQRFKYNITVKNGVSKSTDCERKSYEFQTKLNSI